MAAGAGAVGAVGTGTVVVAAGALVLGVLVSVFWENAGVLNNNPAAARLSKTLFIVVSSGSVRPRIERFCAICVPRILLNRRSAIRSRTRSLFTMRATEANKPNGVFPR